MRILMNPEVLGEGGAAENPLPVSPVPAYPPLWQERVGAFAAAIGKPMTEVTAALQALVDPTDEGASQLSDDGIASLDLIKGALASLSIPIVKLNAAVKNHLRVNLAAPVSAEVATASNGAVFNVLPQVPDDQSFLEMLKVGGVLKIGRVEVISAMKAALANRVGLFELPAVIVQKMEEYSVAQEEPLGDDFYELQRLVSERRYGEVLSVLRVSGNFMSEKRKRELLDRLDTYLWVGLRSFNDQLLAWQNAWMAGMSNPGMAMSLMAMATAGGAAGPMPPGMMQPPETAGLRDAAEAFINQINKVFAGPGIPVARALAWDANRIKNLLEQSTLPAAIGATNREQMIKMLGIGVGADYVRLELNATRYTLAVMELPKVPAGSEEYAYLGAMIQLGAAIPWDKLADNVGSNGGRPVGIGGRGRKTSLVDE